MVAKIHKYDYNKLEEIFNEIEDKISEARLILKGTPKQAMFEDYAETFYSKGQYCLKDILEGLSTYDGTRIS